MFKSSVVSKSSWEFSLVWNPLKISSSSTRMMQILDLSKSPLQQLLLVNHSVTITVLTVMAIGKSFARIQLTLTTKLLISRQRLSESVNQMLLSNITSIDTFHTWLSSKEPTIPNAPTITKEATASNSWSLWKDTKVWFPNVSLKMMMRDLFLTQYLSSQNKRSSESTLNHSGGNQFQWKCFTQK